MRKQRKSHYHKQSIRRVSEKRKQDNKEYRRVCKRIDKDSITEHGYLCCYFCSKPIHRSVDHHHVAGREGTSDNGISLFLDPQGIVPSHPLCHRAELGGYHGKTLTEVRGEIYFDRLVEKIRSVDRKMYANWMIKLEGYEPKQGPLDNEY